MKSILVYSLYAAVWLSKHGFPWFIIIIVRQKTYLSTSNTWLFHKYVLIGVNQMSAANSEIVFFKGLNVFLAFKWKEISNLTWGKRMRKSSIHTSHFPAHACILLTLFILSKIGDNIYPHFIIIGDSSLQLRYCSIRNCSDQYVSFVEQYFVPKRTC